MSSLDLIEENIHNLVKVQEKVNKVYDNINGDNYNESYNIIFECMRDEQDLLSAITNNLNKYFKIQSRWKFKKFRINRLESCLHRYEIRPPYNLAKDTSEYILLKKLLIRLHEHYFLNDGMTCYGFSRIESHMWEIPDTIYDNELTRKIRKQL